MDEKEKRRLRQRSDSAKVVPVIEVITVIGNGMQENPYTTITEYWSLDGKLLAVRDPDREQPEEHRSY